jgi:hypothetical protein
MPEEPVPTQNLTTPEHEEEQRVQRNLRSVTIGIIVAVLAVVLVVAGLFAAPHFLSAGAQNQPKTNVVDAQQPKLQAGSANQADAEQAKVQQEANSDTPDGYLALMSLDPATLPPAKKPIATVLNNAGAEAAHASAAQFSFLQNIQLNILQPLQTAKNKEDLERLRAQASQLKDIAQQTEKAFSDLQQSLNKRLQEAGLSPDVADQTAAKFIDQARTYRAGESDPAIDISQASTGMVDLLEAHPKDWSRREDGTLVINDPKVLSDYQKLSRDLNQSINRLAARTSGH